LTSKNLFELPNYDYEYVQYDAVMHTAPYTIRRRRAVSVLSSWFTNLTNLSIYLCRPFCYLRNCCGRQTDRQTDRQ